MWGDAKFSGLSKETKLVWIYLLTGPHNTPLPGAFIAGEAMIAEAMNEPLEMVKNSLSKLIELEMLYIDLSARLFWIPNVIKYDPPQSPNVVTSWRRLLDELPECDLKSKIINNFKHNMKALSEAFHKAFLEALPKGFRKDFPKESRKPSLNPEPEPEPYPEQEPTFVEDSTWVGPVGPTKKKKHSFPDGFILTPDMEQCGIDKGISDTIGEFEAFRDHHIAKGSVMADWVAAWKNWIRLSKKFNHGGGYDKSRPDKKYDGIRDFLNAGRPEDNCEGSDDLGGGIPKDGKVAS